MKKDFKIVNLKKHCLKHEMQTHTNFWFILLLVLPALNTEAYRLAFVYFSIFTSRATMISGLNELIKRKLVACFDK